MTPDQLLDAEGDIRWRTDRGWRIASTVDGTWWWYPPEGYDVPPLALTEAETATWETMRPKENPRCRLTRCGSPTPSEPRATAS